MCVRKYLLQKCTTCYFGLSLNPPYVYLCSWLRSPASLHLFLQCSYILFPPFSGSSSFGRLNQTNPARLISFLLARAMTGPRWPSWEATYMCVFMDVQIYMVTKTVCARAGGLSSGDMIVCDEDSRRDRLRFFVSGFRDSGILSSFLPPVTCFMTILLKCHSPRLDCKMSLCGSLVCEQ